MESAHILHIPTGASIDPGNPAASVFRIASGELGYRIFGIVLWSAAITSVIGSAYTSVSFLKTFHPWLEKNSRYVTTIFILFSSIIFALVGRPIKVLVIVGALNGLILPVALFLILIASRKKNIVGEYKHPSWVMVAGWIVVAAMTWMGAHTVASDLALFWE